MLVKLQITSKNKLLDMPFLRVFFIIYIITNSFKKKDINSDFRLVQILRFSFTFNKLETSATSRKVTLIIILQQSI